MVLRAGECSILALDKTTQGGKGRDSRLGMVFANACWAGREEVMLPHTARLGRALQLSLKTGISETCTSCTLLAAPPAALSWSHQRF